VELPKRRLEGAKALFQDSDCLLNLAVDLDVADEQDVVRQIADVGVRRLEGAGHRGDLVGQEHRHPHVPQVSTERVELLAKLALGVLEREPVAGRPVEQDELRAFLLDVLADAVSELVGGNRQRFDFADRELVGLTEVADAHPDRVRAVDEAVLGLLEEIGRRSLAAFGRRSCERGAGRRFADAARTADERDTPPLDTAAHERI